MNRIELANIVGKLLLLAGTLCMTSNVVVASEDPIYPPLATTKTKYCAKCDLSAYFTCKNSACGKITIKVGGIESITSVKFIKFTDVFMYNCKPDEALVAQCKSVATQCGRFVYYLDDSCVAINNFVSPTTGYQYSCGS